MKMRIIIGLCSLLFHPANAQDKQNIIGLLIECYEFIFSPIDEEYLEFEEVAEAIFSCIERPADFYKDYSDTHIGFDLLQIKEVVSFSFRDSVASPLKIPLRLTSRYGEVRKNGKIHQGVDFGLSIGDTVYSVFCGEVRIEKYDPIGYGNVVVVRNYNMSETLYGHLDKSLVRNGQKVVVGQPIGIGGNTGTSSGPHLHFEIRSSGYSFNPVIDGKFFKKYILTN